ncbi:MAG: hypothetical protein E5W98_12080 [Mesorhizobium sp.]|nr:MAG: hypothetical protein E5W98_12080 [Mesorhizobium sp.]
MKRDYKNIDPVVTTARARMKAFTWTAESPRRYRRPSSQALC